MFWGASREEVMQHNPKELECYKLVYKKRMLHEDENNWLLGRYINIATSVAIANCFSKNSNAKYLEEPLMQTYENEHRELSEEEKIEQTKLWFSMLESIGERYNNSKNDNQGK